MSPARAVAADPLPPGVPEALARGGAFPHDPSAPERVRWIQTHLSHVFLTGSFVYKLRKPVDLGFVDFSTRRERNADCLRELALNRRLSPDVYLGVAALVPGADGRGVLVEPFGEGLVDERLEHCVVMRRLPDQRDALALLAAGRLRAGQLDAVAECVADFHRSHGLGAPAPFPPDAWRERVWRPVAECLDALHAAAGRHVSRAGPRRLARRAEEFFATHAARFERRRRQGRAVDGHGDLHLQHVWFESDDAPPRLVDCIEFREDLRRIDAAAEVAFLAMDLRYRRRGRLGERFLRRYARATDDFDLYGVVDFYVSYRAAVRAKVAVLAADDADVPATQRAAASESARRHLALAVRALAPRPPGRVVLVCGVIGTGKTTVAERLADELGGVVISSDRVRKARAGLAPTARAGAAPGAGLYAPRVTEQVYVGLLERALPVVASGRMAILDATYATRARRDAARAWARRHARDLYSVETRCGAEVALERLARRQREGQDPSDAGPSLYRSSVAGFEPVREAPSGTHAIVATDASDWRRQVRELARTLRRAR